MNKVITIFRKEFLETLRDKRTLALMILVPLVIYPLLFTIFSKVETSQAEKAIKSKKRISIETQGQKIDLGTAILQIPNAKSYQNLGLDTTAAAKLVREDSLDAVFIFDLGFNEAQKNFQTSKLTLVYDKSKTLLPMQMLNGFTENLNQALLKKRMDSLNLDASFVQPIQQEELNVASKKQFLGLVAGGVLPYFFIIFCFLGSMYPAIDLITGEKERGTIETLLVTPPNRMQILMGKFGVVFLSGLTSALVSLIGLFAALKLMDGVSNEIIETALTILKPSTLVILLTLLLPVALFIGALLITLSVYSQSFKEAQSKINPVAMFIFIPAIVGMLPAFELNMLNAWIPFFNLTLACKSVIAGTVKVGPLAMVYISQITLAVLGIWVSSRVYRREGNVVKA